MDQAESDAQQQAEAEAQQQAESEAQQAESDAESEAQQLFECYHTSKNRQEFVSKCINSLLVGDKYVAAIAWECIDRVYDLEDITPNKDNWERD